MRRRPSTPSARASLAAGEATLAVFHGTAFWVSYLLGSVGGLIVAAIMLLTTVFSKATAYLCIAPSVLDFGASMQHRHLAPVGGSFGTW